MGPSSPPAPLRLQPRQPRRRLPSPRRCCEGYWAEFLAEFQSEKIGGIARQFPTHVLCGADEVLARLVHERVTRSHTPLKLGEIVAHRQFTASGQINPFRIKEEPGSRMLLRDDGLFDRAPRHVPEPQKLQTFLDFLESVKYGLLFARWGPELSIDAWVGWFSNLVRDHPQKYPQLRELYLRSSWTLCMELRQGVPFATAYKTVPWWPRQTWRRRSRATSPPTPRAKAPKASRRGSSRQSSPSPRGTRANAQAPTARAQVRLQVPSLQVQASREACPSVACSLRDTASLTHGAQQPTAGHEPCGLGTARSAPAAKSATRSDQWATCSTPGVWCRTPEPRRFASPP